MMLCLQLMFSISLFKHSLSSFAAMQGCFSSTILLILEGLLLRMKRSWALVGLFSGLSSLSYQSFASFSWMLLYRFLGDEERALGTKKS